MIDKITVYEDHLEVHLQSDIDALLQSTREENVVNFNSGIENSEKCRIVQRSRNQKDRDAVIAAAGGVKKDILERSISSELEQLMERRECYERGADEQPEVLISSQDGCAVVAEAPIITDGDVSGCVAFVSENEDEKADEVLLKLCQSAAQFLSKRIAV